MRLGIGHPGAREKVTGHVLGDFAKADQEWLDKLLQAIADNAPLLADGKDANFMNKVALDIGQNKDAKKPKAANQKAQSHVHQARTPKRKTRNHLPKRNHLATLSKALR